MATCEDCLEEFEPEADEKICFDCEMFEDKDNVADDYSDAEKEVNETRDIQTDDPYHITNGQQTAYAFKVISNRGYFTCDEQKTWYENNIRKAHKEFSGKELPSLKHLKIKGEK